MDSLGLKYQQEIDSIEDFQFAPIKGYPRLNWQGKRPFKSTHYYPAQLKESYGEDMNGWYNKLYWGDNLQVMSHLLKQYRGQIDLIYIDPPFDSKADYKKTIELRGAVASNDSTAFEEKQYTDIWTNDEYLQFMFERLILLRELLADTGSIYLHCDWHKVHLLRCIMDEVFGADNFRNEIVWCYTGASNVGGDFPKKHDNILRYSKTDNYAFYADEIRIPYAEGSLDRANRNVIGTGGMNFDKIELNSKGKVPEDYWIDIQRAARYPGEVVGYPTQKSEKLLERIIKASSKKGDLVFDCFMGSGTTQVVAMKLGRRFLGADINFGSIDTTVSRLVQVSEELTHNEKTLFNEKDKIYYRGFEVYNVNNYEFFRNPVEAKQLLIQALELQPLPNNGLYDGEKDGRMTKIMPVNRIATRADLNELITNFPYALFDKRKEESPSSPVELLTLVCMGHEPDLGSQLELQMKASGYMIDVEVLDVLTNRRDIQFKRDSEADIIIEGTKLVIRDFYPMNLLQKLSLQKEEIDDWRTLVSSIKVDFYYDEAVFSPSVVDVPEKKAFAKGVYTIPKDATRIRVKITDILSESFEQTIEI